MFLKIIGSLLLVGSSVGIALYLNRAEEYKLSYADGWIAMIRYVKAQVECYSLPAEDILLNCDKDLFRRCGYISDPPPDSLEMLSEAANKGDADIGNTVRAFFSEFGRCYREEQVKRCTYCLSVLEGRRGELKEQLPVKKRMNLTLFISGSLILAIIFL